MLDSPPALIAGLPRHGGAIAAAEARFGKPAQGWLDLSTGINPFPYPVPPLDPAVWTRLPDEGAEAALRQAAARAWAVADPEQIVVAPGAQALIQLLPLLRAPEPVAVVGPTTPGHADAFAHAGHPVIACASLDDIGEAAMAVVVNPNNPDGRSWHPDALIETARHLAARDGLLIVDEAFVDLSPELSVASRVCPGLVVLRSFGEFHGLAGLRLGFAVAVPDTAIILRDVLGPWATSGPALEIGRIALADRRWAERMRRRLADEAARTDSFLTRHGLAILGGTDLFRLAGAPRAWALYEHLARRGILVQPFAHELRWLRFNLLPDDAARERLAAALSDWR